MSQSAYKYRDEIDEKINQFYSRLGITTIDRRQFLRSDWGVDDMDAEKSDTKIIANRILMKLINSKNRIKQIIEQQGENVAYNFIYTIIISEFFGYRKFTT